MPAAIAYCTNVSEPAPIEVTGSALEKSTVVVYPPLLRFISSYNFSLLIVRIQGILYLRMANPIELEAVLE